MTNGSRRGAETVSDEKTAFRARVRAKIKQLPEEYIRSSDAGIMKQVLALEVFRSAKTVFAYASVGREVDTKGIIESAVEDGKRVCLPRTGSGGEMDFADISAGLHVARYGIPEPDGSLPALEPGREDVIIVPAVCCDRSGARLGQGGGYYDRYLARYPDAVTVCLCRERLLSEKVPVEWNDVRTGYVITEERIIKTGP